MNLSKEKIGLLTGPDVTKETIDQLNKAKLTKHIFLLVANSMHNPMGITLPITILLKVAMKKIFSPEHNLEWGTDLHQS